MGLFGTDEQDKARLWLKAELEHVKEANSDLTCQLTAAVGARTSAVSKVRELEDVLRLKDQLSSDTERQLSRAQVSIEALETQLHAAQARLDAVQVERTLHPLSDLDLIYRHERLVAFFDSLADTLTCPICYSSFSRNGVVSLMCGHNFCSHCLDAWEHRHLENFKISTVQGQYLGPDCPECRSTEVKRGKVRIYAMEEVIRIVEKGVKNSTTLFEPPPVAPSDAAAFALPPSGPASDVEEASAPSPDEEAAGTARASEEMEEDGENDLDPSPAPHAVARGHTEGEAEDEVVDPDAASILRRRTPLPYGG